MAQVFIRHAGWETEMVSADFPLSWVAQQQELRSLVVQLYIDAPTRGEMEDEYTVVKQDMHGESVLDAGTIRQAYASLSSEDRIDLLMLYIGRHVDGDLNRLGELPTEVKYLLSSSKQ